jgi:alanyl-tRNA synthetase
VTERLYYSDCYLASFHARVVATEDAGRRVYLDQTAFYPASGGQPFDLGTLGGARVVEIVDEDDRVAHLLASPLAKAAEVAAEIDWTRRFDHMQQHTGQHLLSAVFEELYSLPTLSFHMGAETSTIDIGAASLEPAKAERVEERCAELVGRALPVRISFEDAAGAEGLRKESKREGMLRIIGIEGVDRSACGGTHVRSTAEIGPMFIRKIEKMRGNVRVEFVCGGRALKHARSDYRTLAEVGRILSAPFERAPELIAAQAERIKVAEKAAQKLESELRVREGREMYASRVPGEDGIRRVRFDGAIDDTMRARAQGFVSEGKAVFLSVCQEPPSVLLVVSPGSGVNAGAKVKAAVTRHGGRGGGNALLAQGSVPTVEALEAVVKELDG